jgi:hypothetical protein
MGLYVGEILVRHPGGRWTEDTTKMQPAVDLPGGRVYPTVRILGRVADAHGESIEDWIRELSAQAS